MTRKIIEATNFGEMKSPAGPGFEGLNVHPQIVTPGDVADQSGDFWADAIGDRVVHGELAVTLEQATMAAAYGWKTVPGSENEGEVTVQRPRPCPRL